MKASNIKEKNGNVDLIKIKILYSWKDTIKKKLICKIYFKKPLNKSVRKWQTTNYFKWEKESIQIANKHMKRWPTTITKETQWWHLSSTAESTTKKMNKSKCQWGCGATENHTLVVGRQTAQNALVNWLAASFWS